MAYYRDKIENTLQQKLKAYEEFLATSLLLHKALESEELVLISKLVACRDTLIKDINGWDLLLNRHRQNFKPDFQAAVGSPSAALSEALKKKLKQIIAVNQDCDALAVSKCCNGKRNLEAFLQQEAGLRGYRPSKGRVPKFLDIKT